MRKRSQALQPQQVPDDIAETSEKLQNEVEKAAREEIETRRADDWPSANRAQETPIREDIGRIMERIFIEDPEPIYEKLEEQLRIGEERSDRGVLLRALDNAEANARLAHRLWMTAKLEQQRFELNNRPIYATLRSEANTELQREKDRKERSKQISEADVEDMIAQMHPDEYEAQEIRRKKAEFMVKSMENLAELWMQRCKSLESMLGKSR